MSTDLFNKKRWAYIGLSQIFALFTFIFLIYAAFLSRAESVWLGKSFYFLVSQTEHIEVATYDARLNGGAGYLLEYNGRDYVALAVYLNEEDGNTVQAAMMKNGENTGLIQVNVNRLYFKGCEEKKHAPLYQGALDCLYGCMEVLGVEIERLDDGATQQSSVRTLGLLLRQLKYLAAEYQTSYTACATVCNEAEECLRGILENTIYTKDLRYLLCNLSSEYIRLASAFAL